MIFGRLVLDRCPEIPVEIRCPDQLDPVTTLRGCGNPMHRSAGAASCLVGPGLSPLSRSAGPGNRAPGHGNTSRQSAGALEPRWLRISSPFSLRRRASGSNIWRCGYARHYQDVCLKSTSSYRNPLGVQKNTPRREPETPECRDMHTALKAQGWGWGA